VGHLSRVAKAHDAAAKGPSRITCHWTSQHTLSVHIRAIKRLQRSRPFPAGRRLADKISNLLCISLKHLPRLSPRSTSTRCRKVAFHVQHSRRSDGSFPRPLYQADDLSSKGISRKLIGSSPWQQSVRLRQYKIRKGPTASRAVYEAGQKH
jgi:hypothetical protein